MKDIDKFTCGNGEGMFKSDNGTWVHISDVNQRVIEELEKYKRMMEEVRDGREDHSLNDFIVGLGRTIKELKQ
jgi:cold shock CspA family protein